MKKVLLIIVSVACSCSTPKLKEAGLKSNLGGIGDWKVIKYTEQVMDTTKIGNWLPDAAISATFQNRMIVVPLA
jgi:hypothetical protein